jgi:hypothetical protein
MPAQPAAGEQQDEPVTFVHAGIVQNRVRTRCGMSAQLSGIRAVALMRVNSRTDTISE